MTGVIATRLDPAELGAMIAWLEAARLPTDDVVAQGRIFYRFDAAAPGGVAKAETTRAPAPLGFGGLEGSGADRLLRSVVVAPERRGSGVGAALVAALEEAARGDGAQRLHLLTTTAARFFATHGYRPADRGAAPAAIAASREFTALCPASATYMVKTL